MEAVRVRVEAVHVRMEAVRVRVEAVRVHVRVEGAVRAQGRVQIGRGTAGVPASWRRSRGRAVNWQTPPRSCLVAGGWGILLAGGTFECVPPASVPPPLATWES